MVRVFPEIDKAARNEIGKERPGWNPTDYHASREMSECVSLARHYICVDMQKKARAEYVRLAARAIAAIEAIDKRLEVG